MTIYTIPVGELGGAVQIQVERGNSVGYPAESRVLDALGGMTFKQTERTIYSGYCHAEICEQEIAKLFPGEEWEVVNYYVAAAEVVPECECED